MSSLRIRLALQSLAFAISIGGVATLSILVFRGQIRALRPMQLFSAAPGVAPRAGAASSGVRPTSLVHDQALVNVSHEPEAIREPPKKNPMPERHLSASELFLLASQAREQGRLSEAVARAQQTQQLFPSTPEGVKSHLLLGMIYLQQNEPNRALGELATYRHIGDPETMAEALWAQAQALRQLARADDERQIIAELMKSYPRSVYVAAARDRLSVLSAPVP